MNVHELTMKFLQMRNYSPENVNELLDFTKKAYIHNDICITDYRKLVRELEAQGAEVPDFLKST
ncbi:YppF family protein [Bacillus sp. S/N-304-OC-R1]|uniref:YppF family protein n=1 Tax=Bacillus sp. S/N-304-OC-R1 TaxID=2758034 RepID=UPI001C8DBCDA|nr:YppF family protein [Bacillus sp. S/N-304-OC-R1]MBY0122630.1 YppF family protein [Bacillus sp. S/N-304-OC-R1]